jgi:hypothetical protein
MSKPAKKINVKERLTDDSLDLSLSGLEIVPIKEIVINLNILLLKNLMS